MVPDEKVLLVSFLTWGTQHLAWCGMVIVTGGAWAKISPLREKVAAIRRANADLISDVREAQDEARLALSELDRSRHSAFATLRKWAWCVDETVPRRGLHATPKLGPDVSTIPEGGDPDAKIQAFILRDGVASLAASTLTTAGAWGLAGLLGTASTGAPIVTLHGIAAYNATLAFFGGGALAAGGAGMAGGALVLTGIFALPVLVVASWTKRERLLQWEVDLAQTLRESNVHKRRLKAAHSTLRSLTTFARRAQTDLDAAEYRLTCELAAVARVEHLARWSGPFWWRVCRLLAARREVRGLGAVRVAVTGLDEAVRRSLSLPIDVRASLDSPVR